MKIYVPLLLISLLSLMFSCADSTQSDKNMVTLEGTVYSLNESNEVSPLAEALVSATNAYSQTRTDAAGTYRLSLELDKTEEERLVKLEASKAGYETASASILAKKGTTLTMPDLTLRKMLNDSTGSDTTTVDTSVVSGEAAHVEIYGEHPQHIYVAGSGLTETARINFLVTDGEGVPVDADHRVQVKFNILNGPGGGEYLFPDTMTTRNGKVYTVLSSGIVAGPVQVQASLQMSGAAVSTSPIRLAIYGGLPDPAHFSLAADVLNIAGLKFSGLTDYITAFVGDKYSNPVAPGTVVYFSSDYGIIDGSSETDELGRASVQFLTAAPRPPAPANDAFVNITGWTYSDSLEEHSITSDTRVLLTDNTAPISVSPGGFTYNDSNTPVNFHYAVNDVWGRPLVGDSKLRVTATDGNLFGDTDINLQDTQVSGPGSTEFDFTWVPGDSLDAPQVYINIKVTTPANGNGYRSINVLGTKE